MIEFVPTFPGNYGLIVRLAHTTRIAVGRLGTFDFPPGLYLYAGSARGPGGLRARILHHCESKARSIWHLDYLRPYVQVTGCLYVIGKDTLECLLIQRIEAITGRSYPAPGFGSSDCNSGCVAHLVRLPDQVQLNAILRTVAVDYSYIGNKGASIVP